MRLINTKTLQLEEFIGRIPDYAILSHRWGSDEVSYQDMLNLDPAVQRKEGFAKIKYTCDQAAKDGLDWAWVDTSCIDKKSSAELSESINSMFRWYQNAQVCYAYLNDVKNDGPVLPFVNFEKSAWFSRGFTLQELLAPRYLEFYDCDWNLIGDKFELASRIAERTGIRTAVINSMSLKSANVAEKMSWAARRQTTRLEDEAYCLLGIFDVNMPLLYGEGIKAFTRLQEEILKRTYDPTIFSWGLPSEMIADWPMTISQSESLSLAGLLALRPLYFDTAQSMEAIDGWPNFGSVAPIFSSRGVRIVAPLLQLTSADYILQGSQQQLVHEPIAVALLGFRPKSWGFDALGVVLRRWQEVSWGRESSDRGPMAVRVPVGRQYEDLRRHVAVFDVKEKPLAYTGSFDTLFLSERMILGSIAGYSVQNFVTVPPADYDQALQAVTLYSQSHTMDLGLVYSNAKGDRFALCFYASVPGAFKFFNLGQGDLDTPHVFMRYLVTTAPVRTNPAISESGLPITLRMPEFRLRNYLRALAVDQEHVEIQLRATYFMPATVSLTDGTSLEIYHKPSCRGLGMPFAQVDARPQEVSNSDGI
ncbi:HET-domain-containing protein [Xylariaceae sp. FL0016]|nr:HET-domain-containing protein [Xylariaceae sp. FL0016]